MNLNKKTIGVVVVILIGVIGIVGLLGKQGKSKSATLEGPKEGQFVKVEKAKKANIQTKVSATGTLYADVSETVFSESNNKVVLINKKVGDAVKKGEVILTLDKDIKNKTQKEIEKINLNIETAKISLKQMQSGSKQEVLEAQSRIAEIEKSEQDSKENIRSTKASLATAEKDMVTLESEYNLTNQLFVEGLASQQELDKAKKDLDVAKENITSLKNKIVSIQQGLENLSIQKETAQYNLNVLLNNVEDQKKAQNIAIKENDIKSLELQKQILIDDLAKTVDSIKAPMDGIVAEVMIEEGSSIAPGTPLVKVIEPSKLIVKSEVSPFYAAQLQEGLQATIKYNGSQTIELAGKISKVSPTAITKVGANNTNTTAIPIEIEITDSVEGLKPGLVVDVRIITTDVNDVVTVPLLATMEDKEGESYILVVKDDFTLEKVYVEKGAADNQSVEIKGLEEGAVVVTNPTEALDNGVIVNYTPFKEEVVKEGEVS